MAITVTVKLGSTLRAHCPAGFAGGEGTLSVTEGGRVEDLLDLLGLTAGDVNLIYKNHRLVDGTSRLADGDRVSLFPPNFIHFSQFYLKREEDDDCR